MTRLIFITLLTAYMKIGSAQITDQSIKPLFISTEFIVTQLQDSIIHYGSTNRDSLNYFLDKWDQIDGKNEAIERVKILKDIEHNRFDTERYDYYFNNCISQYHHRVYNALEVNHTEIYNEHKEFFNYVPFNSKFDSWSKSLAEDLLSDQLYGSDAYLMCLLFTDNLEAFDDALRSKKYKNSNVKTTYVNSMWIFRRTEGFYKVYVGHWLPIGKLSQDFKQSLNVGFSMGIPIKLKYRAEVKIQVATAPNKSELEFRFDDVLHKTSDLTIVSGGFKFIKEHKISKFLFFDISTEVNVSTISTDIKDPNGETENSTHSVETIDLGLGIGLKRFVGKYNAIGIETVLHLSPYNFNNKLISDSGSLFLSTSMFLSF